MEVAPRVRVRIDESGALVDVDVEGQPDLTELDETTPAEAIPSFGDEQFKARVHPWAAGA